MCARRWLKSRLPTRRAFIIFLKTRLWRKSWWRTARYIVCWNRAKWRNWLRIYAATPPVALRAARKQLTAAGLLSNRLTFTTQTRYRKEQAHGTGFYGGIARTTGCGGRTAVTGRGDLA